MELPHFHALSYTAISSGPRLILLGGVHGNETCGITALRRLQAALDNGDVHLRAGALTLVPVCNPLAHARGRRMGERNLNRRLMPAPTPRQFEDHVANWLCPLLAQHDVLLDLHSFHTAGEAFAMLGPLDNDGPLEPFGRSADEERLARVLGVRRFVDGWLETYATGVVRRLERARCQGADLDGLDVDPLYGVGTTEYMRRAGGYGLTLECGQHQDPQAPELAWRAVLNTLAALGMIEADVPAPVAVREAEMLRLFDVIDRLDDGDHFAREWSSFDPVAAGEPVGFRADRTPVVAPCDARIVFPNPAAGLGQEWFYLARAVPRFADT